MPCYKPLIGWRSDERNENGKFPVVFSLPKGKDLPETSIVCGRCIGCRLEKSRQWAMRLVNESTLHSQNCFITLTYNDENLPSDMSLDKKVFQDFMKSLRHKIAPIKIRFYACGEYGVDQELLKEGIYAIGRPHYHAIIFGYDFPDRVPLSRSPDGKMLYESAELNKVWGNGFASLGTVEFDSCAYVARYCMKKITGDDAIDHYQYFDPESGEIHLREPEFPLMSRRPGIGKKYFEKFKTDFEKGFITVNGRKVQLPKYYDQLLEASDPFLMDDIKAYRLEIALANKEENSFIEYCRGNTKERILKRKLKPREKL